MCGGLRFGTTVVTLPKFDPLGFLEACQRHQVTWMSLVPPIIAFLSKHPAVPSYDLSRVRAIMNGAAPLDQDTQMALQKRLPNVKCRQGAWMWENQLRWGKHVSPR